MSKPNSTLNSSTIYKTTMNAAVFRLHSGKKPGFPMYIHPSLLPINLTPPWNPKALWNSVKNTVMGNKRYDFGLDIFKAGINTLIMINTYETEATNQFQYLNYCFETVF